MLVLEVLKGTLLHLVDPSETVELPPGLEDGGLVLALPPANKGPDRGVVGLCLLLLKCRLRAELDAGEAESGTVGLWLVARDALLEEDFGRADVPHDDLVGRIVSLNLRDELLDRSARLALLFMDCGYLHLDRFFGPAVKGVLVGREGMAGDGVYEVAYDEKEDQGEGCIKEEAEDVEGVDHDGPHEVEEEAEGSEDVRNGATVVEEAEDEEGAEGENEVEKGRHLEWW